MMHEQDYKKMNGKVEMTETMDPIEDMTPEQTSDQENLFMKGSDPAPERKNSWKARRTELVAGLVVGALLIFGAGFGCGSLSANNNKDHFRPQASAGQEPGPGQDGRIGGGFRDGAQNHPGRGGHGHGPCFGGGQGGSDNQQDMGNPPAGNRPGAPDGMNPGPDSNGQPGQDTDQSKDSTGQSKDSTSQSKDSTTQSKDSTSQSKDSTTQSKDSTSQSKDSTTQSKNSTPQSTDNSNISDYGSEL